MNREKLIITLEVEDWPDDVNVVDFSFAVMEKGWLTKIFKNWRKLVIKRVPIIDLKVEKLPQ